jgi:small subunit ribosomal protein S2
LGTIPDVVFVVDIGHEKNAVREAQTLRLPIIGVVDSNHNPEGIDYVIAGNDDSIRAIGYYARKIADAVLEAKASIVETRPAAKKEATKKPAAKKEASEESTEAVAPAEEKKPAAKKPAAKKKVSEESTEAEAPAEEKKPAAKKPAAKKPAEKKEATKKPAAKKPAAKKTSTKKTEADK